MSIRSLIFDFDGLILDTETPDYRSWEAIYREYGHEFPMEAWTSIIGGHGLTSFNAASHLADLAGGGLDPAHLRARQQKQSDDILASQTVMPGVTRLLGQARKAGLRLAIASSSPHSWVDTHLARIGLDGRFDRVICAEDVPPGRTKPHPDLFLKALEALNTPPGQAIVFEDSSNGVRAAKAAGIFVVAVPNAATAVLGVKGADLTLRSLEEFDLSRHL